MAPPPSLAPSQQETRSASGASNDPRGTPSYQVLLGGGSGEAEGALGQDSGTELTWVQLSTNPGPTLDQRPGGRHRRRGGMCTRNKK